MQRRNGTLSASGKGGVAVRLEAKDITFYYRGRKKKPVLKEFSIAVESGERVGLRAPSGRGKTTLCRLLAGYEKPRKGQILLDGKPLAGYRGACPVQMVWQHPETVVDPLLRLKDTLAEAGEIDAELMEKLHIEEGWLERFPTELSGGELQRFCLARALHSGTRFLLCDEISAMLDLVTQAQIWDLLLKETWKRDLGLLVVSHNEALVERVCTRVVDLP